jgi:hypothetical protein
VPVLGDVLRVEELYVHTQENRERDHGVVPGEVQSDSDSNALKNGSSGGTRPSSARAEGAADRRSVRARRGSHC